MTRAAVIVCAVLLLAACGSGGGKQSPEDQIKAAYLGFFSTTGSLADHAALLENGTKMMSAIVAFRIVGAAPGSVSASVSKVTLQGPARAEVIFDVKYSAYTLNDRVGYAVLQGGKWKVGTGTVCGLLSIYTGSPPAGCSS